MKTKTWLYFKNLFHKFKRIKYYKYNEAKDKI